MPIDASLEDFDFSELLHEAVGVKFEFNLQYSGYWDLRFTHATKYRSGRILIARDAAHSHPPYGGYGVNTGFEDARNLAWKLAAVYHGWGNENLIDSYSAEREPVFSSTRDDFILRMIKYDAAFVSQFSPEKDLQAFEMAWHQRADQGQREVIGFVPHYLGSPIVIRTSLKAEHVDSVDTEIPMLSGAKGTHTHVPVGGMHLSLGYFNGAKNLFDSLSQDFTILVPPGGDWVAQKFEQCAKALGIPLVCRDVTINRRHANDEHGASVGLANAGHDNHPVNESQPDRCVLVRPDHFIAWVEHENSRQSLLDSYYASKVLAYCTGNLL